MKSLRLGCCLIVAALVAAWVSGASPADDPSLLTLERIYKTEEFDVKPFDARWLDSESAFTTLEKSASTEGAKDIVRHDAATGETKIRVAADELIPPGQSKPLEVEDYAWSRDESLVLIYTNAQRVWRQKTRGDYWLLDRDSKQLRQLGGKAPPATLMFAKLSPDGEHAAYVRQRNLYLENLRTGKIRALTKTPSNDIINGTFDWVYEEELGLRDGFRWSPDGKSIAYWQIDTSGVERFPLVNNTGSLYPKVTWFAYPKVGEKNPASRIGVVSVSSGKTRWIEPDGDPRNQYIARMDWAESSGEILLRVLNRLQNTNRVLLANVKSAQVRTLLTERDDAWVPIHDELQWLDQGKRFTWISERDGWRHAYIGSRESGDLERFTAGDFDVIELLRTDGDAGWAYFIASPDDPTRRYLYRIHLDGPGLERLTPGDAPGWHDYKISHGGQWAIHTFSSMDAPPVVDLISLPGHRRIRLLEDNSEVRKKWSALKLASTEFFRVNIGGGVRLDGWMLKPPDFDPAGKYPLLVFVYGEPAGQTVTDRWSQRHQPWHQMLAQKGYVVMSVDNRGTPSPRGRDWRKAVYRQVGILAPKEQAAAVKKVLAERPYLDSHRVGVWGWSGGGSMTLNAMFKYPELYKVGIAVAPVPDQRYYDTIYQERYMGLPKENEEGFHAGSPIHFAGRLKGDLLLIHGSGDDNVHYQGTERLINELIRHDKPFQMMSYPNRTHAIREGENTTLHLRTLMTRYLLDHLPPGRTAAVE